MLGLRGEVAAQLVNRRSDPCCRRGCSQTLDQSISADSGEYYLNHHGDSQQAGKGSVAEQHAYESRNQHGWVEQRRLNVLEDGITAVAVWFPQRELAAAERIGDEGGPGDVRGAEIPGEHVPWIEQHVPIECDGADQQRDRIEATPGQRIRYQIVTALILVLCAVWYYKANVRRQITGLAGPSDFSEYYRAARDVLSGVSPYENPAWFYPPLTALLLAPFALTDYVSARWIWFVLSHVFLLSAAWLLWRLGGRGYVLACCIAVVWAFGGAAGEMFMNGQISAVLVLLLVLAYTLESGVAIGVGFALKYIPGVLAVVLLFKRRWRALWTFVFVGVAGVLVPWLVAGANAPAKARYWMGTPATYNWSFPAIVLRVLD